MLKNVILLLLFIFSVVQSACTNAANNQKQATSDPSVSTSRNAENTRPDNRSDANTSPPTTAKDSRVPQKVYKVLEYVRANGQAMNGYVGGRIFGNREQVLPKQATDGRRIKYQEWDVNPKIDGRNRGVERLVTGSDGRAWFTNDHYQHFAEVK